MRNESNLLLVYFIVKILYFVLSNAHGIAPNAIRLNCGIRKAREDKVPKSQLVVGVGRLHLEGLLLFMYFKFIL